MTSQQGGVTGPSSGARAAKHSSGRRDSDVRYPHQESPQTDRGSQVVCIPVRAIKLVTQLFASQAFRKSSGREIRPSGANGCPQQVPAVTVSSNQRVCKGFACVGELQQAPPGETRHADRLGVRGAAEGLLDPEGVAQGAAGKQMDELRNLWPVRFERIAGTGPGVNSGSR